MRSIMRLPFLILVVSVIFGCVTMPPPEIEEEEGVLIQLPYKRAFQETIDLLNSRGYTIALADRNLGIIETHPKRVPDEQGPVYHKTVVSILLRGDRVQTVAYLRLIVYSEHEAEREEILDSLKRLSR